MAILRDWGCVEWLLEMVQHPVTRPAALRLILQTIKLDTSIDNYHGYEKQTKQEQRKKIKVKQHIFPVGLLISTLRIDPFFYISFIYFKSFYLNIVNCAIYLSFSLIISIPSQRSRGPR
jgi:hypothetical protein